MLYSDLPYVQAGGHGGKRAQTQMVVIHDTGNTASDEGEASYARWRPDGTSAHFYNDDDSVIQALDTDIVAYGCYPTGNGRSVQFEMVRAITDASMRRVAPIVARVCQLYGLPVRKISALDLRNGVRGICGHGDVTTAWGEGTHTDPGPSFDWSRFIGYVAQASGTIPAPAPVPAYVLPAGHVYGPLTGPYWQHGGFYLSERPAVRAIQQQLIRRGCVPGITDPLSSWADGLYEAPTVAAVKRFQDPRGLVVDGLVGPRTWEQLFR